VAASGEGTSPTEDFSSSLVMLIHLDQRCFVVKISLEKKKRKKRGRTSFKGGGAGERSKR
jgi:hypothetical protein